MVLDSLWQSLEASAVGSYIAGAEFAFPMIETVHVIAIVPVVGAIAIMDLRLLGVASRSCSVTLMSRDTLPWTWGAFVIALISGSLLFVSKATSYAANPYFITKMVFMALAGLNMAFFHLGVWKTVHNWNADCEIPRSAKLAGGLSLLFWVLVVFFGRAVGFTLGIYEA
jgi:uncharacterized protein DUF6644